MNQDDWRRPLRNSRAYLANLEAFVQEFIPWTIRSGFEPTVELPFDEQLALEAAETIARRMVTAVAISNASSWREAAKSRSPASASLRRCGRKWIHPSACVSTSWSLKTRG